MDDLLRSIVPFCCHLALALDISLFSLFAVLKQSKVQRIANIQRMRQGVNRFLKPCVGVLQMTLKQPSTFTLRNNLTILGFQDVGPIA
jgi:hypothetical protein